MTILRVNAATWGTGTQLTSGQANQIDLNTTYALDKRGGQVDTLASVVSCAGAGRIIGSYAVGADANTTYLVTGGNSTIDVPNLSANRTYTLGVAGAVAGDIVYVTMRNTSFVLAVVDGSTSGVLATLSTGAVNSIAGESTWGQYLYTGTAWVRSASDGLRLQLSWTFLASTTWVCPPGLNEIRLEGWGSGGGGGGGGGGSTTSVNSASGGGGGGAAVRVCGRVRVTPGTSYQITIAIGGPGGAAGTPNAGSDGQTTAFRIPASAALFSANGGQGGSFGIFAQPPAYSPLNLGGASVQNANGGRNIYSLTDPSAYIAFVRTPPSFGGAGASANATSPYAVATPGGSSTEFGSSGGAPGASGASSGGTYSGGGGGGGGGGGPWDGVSFPVPTSVPNGGIGGAGGAGNNAGVGSPGNSGASAIAGGGAGGGGGGAAGQGSGAGGSGGAGGNGGSGLLIIYGVH